MGRNVVNPLPTRKRPTQAPEWTTSFAKMCRAHPEMGHVGIVSRFKGFIERVPTRPAGADPHFGHSTDPRDSS